MTLHIIHSLEQHLGGGIQLRALEGVGYQIANVIGSDSAVDHHVATTTIDAVGQDAASSGRSRWIDIGMHVHHQAGRHLHYCFVQRGGRWGMFSNINMSGRR